VGNGPSVQGQDRGRRGDRLRLLFCARRGLVLRDRVARATVVQLGNRCGTTCFTRPTSMGSSSRSEGARADLSPWWRDSRTRLGTCELPERKVWAPAVTELVLELVALA